VCFRRKLTNENICFRNEYFSTKRTHRDLRQIEGLSVEPNENSQTKMCVFATNFFNVETYRRDSANLPNQSIPEEGSSLFSFWLSFFLEKNGCEKKNFHLGS